MTDFSLQAHVLTRRRSVSARFQGGVWIVEAEGEHRIARSLSQALHVARDYMGRFLGGARKDQAWGLVVRAGGFSALYGDPDPAAGIQVGAGVAPDPNSPFMRIYNRWRAGDSPRGALENALDIIREAARQGQLAA